MGPRRCVFGCGNSNTLFPFPPKESKPWLRRKWLEFIHFDEGIIFDNSRLCDRHFIDDCFTNKGMFTAGLASCLLLSENPIPSLYTVGESPNIKCTITRNIGCQTDPPQKKSVGTQCQIKNTYFRSKATQTRLRPESVGVGTPVHWNRPPSLLTSIYPVPESFQPSKKRRLTLDDDDDDDGDSIEVTETYLRNQDTQTYTDTESFEPSKRRRLTLDDDDEYDGDSIEVTLSNADVPRYVVREDSLLQLFKECPMCGSLCEVQKTTRGTLLLVVQLCPQCSFSRKWRSPQAEKMASKRLYKTIGADVWMSRLRTFAASGVWPSEVGNRPSSKQPKWHSLYLKIEKCAGLLSGQTILSEGLQSCVCGFHSVKSVTSGDAFSSTNDPENSATAITEIIGLSDEGSREVDEGGHNSDSSDEGQNEEVDDHSYCHILDPLEHHNIDDELPDEGENGEMDSRDHNSDNWDPPENHSSNSESDTDEKHEKLRQLCPECGMFFFSQAHTCEYKKPCSCIVCGKRYFCEVNLKIHSKTHQDGYKHVCKYCCSTFRIRHEKLVHEQSHLPAEKPYQCPDCPEVFAKMRERSDHLVSHRGPKRHVCLICNMEFSKKCKLERHVVVHTKAKTFVCKVCQRSFTQSSHLKSHMRVHTGEKPYQCQHCDKSFNHNVSLKSHIRHYHGQVPDPGMKVQMEKTSRNESETEKNETNEMERSAADAEEAEKSKDTLCNAKNGGDEEEEKKEDTCTKKCKYYRPTGRPRGRPKKNAVITLEDANQLKRLVCISDEKVQGNSDSTDEEQEHDSDPIFEPVKRRTKKKGGALSHKVRGRCRGKQK